MSQVKPISHGINNFKKLIIELNRNFDTVIKLINSNNKAEPEKPEYQKTTKEYHLFGGSSKDSFAARYYGLGYVTGPDSVPNNSIYTSGNGFYYIKDQDGVSREIGSTGGGGAYLPIDGTAVNSELLDGYDSTEFTFRFDFDSHTGDDSIHFLGTDIDHTAIKNIGTYSHDNLDAHIDNSTIHFAESSIDHANIQNTGTNSHLDIDTHISESSIHFTESSIDHTAIQNIGTNTHTDIDSHISNTGNPHTTTLDQVITANNTTTQNFTTGRHTIRTADISGLTLDNTNSPYFVFKSSSGKTSMEILESGGQKGVIAGTDGSALIGGISLGYTSGTSAYKFRCNGDMFIDGDIYTPDTAFRFKQELDVNGNKVWNAGNDGSGSGLDADLLDGNHASYFAIGSDLSTHTGNSTIHFTEGSVDHTAIKNIGIYSHDTIDTHVDNSTIHFAESSINHGNITGLADDDHTQYHNDTRGDARYLQIGAKAADSDLLDGKDLTASGNRFDVIPYIASDGVMEVGKYLDFHLTDVDTSDYAARMTCVSSAFSSLSNSFYASGFCGASSASDSGTYVVLSKELGSLPGFPTNRFPTLKTDHTTIYFSTNNKQSGFLVYNSDTDVVYRTRSDNGSYTSLIGESGGFAGVEAKYRTSTGISRFVQNSSGGAIALQNSAGTTNCIVSSYGDSYFSGGYVGIGTSSPSHALDVIGDVEISGTIQQESWTNATLYNSWVNVSGHTLKYYKDKQGVVYLYGRISSGSGGVANYFTILPAGYRPTSAPVFNAVSFSGTYTSIFVDPATGQCYFSTDVNNTTAYVYISFSTL